MVLYAFGEKFLVRCKQDDDNVYIWVAYHGSIAGARDYNAKIEFLEADNDGDDDEEDDYYDQDENNDDEYYDEENEQDDYDYGEEEEEYGEDDEYNDEEVILNKLYWKTFIYNLFIKW